MKKLKLLINDKKVICLKKLVHNPKYNTVIILIGAITHASNYSMFAKQFKETEVIIINTPGHGLGKSLTEGESLTDGNDLINFQVSVINRLIKEKHCTSRITLLGYSLGGMTMLNIVNRKLLDKNIDLCLLISSARFTRHNNEFVKGLYNEKTNTFNARLLVEKNFTNKTPWYIRHLNLNWISALPIACYADFLECDSMNIISKNELMLKNDKNIIAFLGEDDFFYSKSEALKTIKNFKHRTFISLEEYGHLFLMERPIKAGKLVFKAIKEAIL